MERRQKNSKGYNLVNWTMVKGPMKHGGIVVKDPSLVYLDMGGGGDDY